MVNFAVCEDNTKINSTVCDIIDKIMMKNKIEYRVHKFLDYNKSFMSFMKADQSCKIYFLDIEMPSSSGLDIARQIREFDVDSIIIFLTSHDELGGTILKSQLMFLTFISKFDNYIESTESAVIKALNVLNEKHIIRFNDNGTLYTIPANDILYITRDSVERKCIMRTHYAEFHLTKSLVQMAEMLDGNFVQTHRACYVNTKRILMVNSRKKIIKFDNGLTIDLISENYKNNIKKFEEEIYKKNLKKEKNMVEKI